MDKHERRQLEQFLTDYDHGKMPGTIIPETVLEGLRTLLNEYVPPDGERCTWRSMAEEGVACNSEATWRFQGRRFCEEHPDDSPEWQWRYGQLRNAVQGAVGQSGSFQELAGDIKKALRATMIEE